MQVVRHPEFDGLQQELFNTAILISITGSIFNDLRSTQACTLPSIAIAFLPPSPTSNSIGIDRTYEGRVGSPMYPLLLSLHDAVDRTSEHSRQLVFNARPNKPVGRLPIEYCTVMWRECAALCLQALDALANLIAVDDGANIRRSDHLVALLVAVCHGSSPCLSGGEATMPSWAERRSFRRHDASIAATLTSRDDVQSVTLTNVSRGGLALVGAAGLDWGTVVTITLTNGRKLMGRIAWVLQEKVGVQLSQELDLGDPLLTSARLATRVATRSLFDGAASCDVGASDPTPRKSHDQSAFGAEHEAYLK